MQRTRSRSIPVLGVALLAAICMAEERPYQELPYTPSLDVSAMNRSVDPCEDLYAYACGGWQQHNPIPADQSSWSVYGKLYVDNQRFLWGILEDAARSDPKRTPIQQKIGDYFAACMDEAAIEQAGIAPLAAGPRAHRAPENQTGSRAAGGGTARACHQRQHAVRKRCRAGRTRCLDDDRGEFMPVALAFRIETTTSRTMRSPSRPGSATSRTSRGSSSCWARRRQLPKSKPRSCCASRHSSRKPR